MKNKIRKKTKKKKKLEHEMIKCYEAVVQRCSVKNVFFGISQNSQENTCARVYF